MVIISLFDGLSAARIALDNLGIRCSHYYSSEIDKYAIQISRKNYPDIIHLGDISNITIKSFSFDTCVQPDLLIGGSPCQNLSCRGDHTGLSGKKSSLFFEYVRVLNELKPNLRYFLFENVASMSKVNRDIISKELGVEPIKIDSACFVPQTRRRYYWTNITIPNSSLLLLKQTDKTVQADILEAAAVSEKFFYNKHAKYRSFWITQYNQKPQSDLPIARPLKTQPYTGRASVDNCYTVALSQAQRFAGKTNLRKLTPREYERLQGIPDNYTLGVSDTQRYKMIGNSFTVPVISYILSFMSE